MRRLTDETARSVSSSHCTRRKRAKNEEEVESNGLFEAHVENKENEPVNQVVAAVCSTKPPSTKPPITKPTTDPPPPRLSERIYEQSVDKDGSTTTFSYLKGRFLGKGGFASCYEVTCEQTCEKYACKWVSKQTLIKPKARSKFISEIKIHKSLKHPHIVHFNRFFEDDESAYILLELCRNQSLSDLLRRRKRLSESEVRFYVRQLVHGLMYLHQQLVIHRDLKLGNLFLTRDMKLKIGDFGLATRLEHFYERKKTLCGTPNYIAPEILTGRGNEGTGHSFEVDIWSLGVVMYTLLIGIPPFETSDVKETYKRIRTIDYTFPDTVPLSSSAKSIIQSILRIEPHLRPSLNAILAHPFFKESPNLHSLPRTALLVTPPECKRSVVSTRVQRKISSPETEPEPEIEKETDPFVQLYTTLCRLFTLEHQYKTELNASTHASVLLEAAQVAKTVRSEHERARKQLLVPSTLWVSQYVDYTSKYGMGYILSNGSAGVYFNDSTKMITSDDHMMVEYMERIESIHEEPYVQYTMEEASDVLTKKTSLLHHFKTYLMDERIKNPMIQQLEQQFISLVPSQQFKPTKRMFFIKKWLKTKHAVFFFISNQTFQFTFYDTSQLILSEQGQVCTYVDKQQDIGVYSTTSVILSKEPYDLVKRLRYVRDMLHQIVRTHK